ncbi:hypothetical protein N656DRAFT_497210 [Canariomyces notabilis]|uniref:Uncharacterized protein n=1 Tax=Canariomyces notabilis TaxID=2074819 RepID=A0AAN6TJ35_9PEZI|nr:hypothetical protein N656DRAFT_497210 [Canariomyces arenarius]
MRGSKIPFIFYLFPTQGLILGPIALQSTQPTDDELARFRLPVLSLLLHYSQCPDPYLSILSTLLFFDRLPGRRSVCSLPATHPFLYRWSRSTVLLPFWQADTFSRNPGVHMARSR